MASQGSRLVDEDGDSTMQSTPDDDRNDDLFPAADAPTTPKVPSSELSPPTSHGRGLFGHSATANPTSLSQPNVDATALNENGKRALNRNSDGNNKGVQTHVKSGYQWEKDEDAPGYAWRNKRADEDMRRSWEHIVDKDRMIGKSYGDVLAPGTRGRTTT